MCKVCSEEEVYFVLEFVEMKSIPQVHVCS